MNAIIAALDEKPFVEPEAAVLAGVKLNHPTAHAVGIELLVPRCVKRVREIDAFAIAAYFYHLRSASQRLVRILRVRHAIDDSTNAHRAGLLRAEWIGYVVLQHLPRSPAGDIQEFVVERQIDV